MIDDIGLNLENFSPESSTKIRYGLYKIRFSPSALSKGKSKSFRLIIYVYYFEDLITPVIAYYKDDIVNLSIKEITIHLKKVIEEIESEISKN